VNTKPVKPGIRTTEFASVVIVNVAAFVAAFQGHLSPKYDAILAGVSVGLYSVGRGLAKLG
jgi:hypothetical protein